MSKLSPEVLQSRQMWFWRRITLQSVVTFLCTVLGYTVIVTADLQNDWPTVATQIGLLTAIVWLVTIYFAAVNDADKIASVVTSIGAAVGDARDGVASVSTTTTATTH